MSHIEQMKLNIKLCYHLLYHIVLHDTFLIRHNLNTMKHHITFTTFNSFTQKWARNVLC